MTDLVARYVDGPFGQVHYRMRGGGAGRPVVFLNPRTRSCFRLLPHFDGPAIFVDVPAYDGSAPPRAETDMQTVAAATVAVLTAEGLENAVLCGIHTGGKIAVATALQVPERVASIMVCGKSHSLVPGRDDRNAAMKYQLTKSAPDYVLLTMEGWRADDPAAAEGRRLVYEANFAYDMAADLAKLRCPVTVLEFTSEDEDADFGRQADALAATTPNGTAIALPQIESLGTDLYCGTAAFARVLTAVRDAA